MPAKKITFVILHYHERSLHETFACIASIKHNLLRGDHIVNQVIVENGSKDSSKNALCDRFAGDPEVSVVCSDENLGFARGNNLGCRFAIDNFQPDFLIVVNNDIIIEQKDFLMQLVDRYDAEEFHILGPNILNPGMIPQNPFYGVDDLAGIEKVIVDFTEKLAALEKMSKIGLCWLSIRTRLRASLFRNIAFKKFWRSITDGSRYKRERRAQDCGHVGPMQRNVMLHGAALVFSRKYYTRYHDVFFPGTFFYFEEAILHQRVKRDGLQSIYYPALQVLHKEGISTHASFSYNKSAFIIKNYLHSAKLYRSIILHGEQQQN